MLGLWVGSCRWPRCPAARWAAEPTPARGGSQRDDSPVDETARRAARTAAAALARLAGLVRAAAWSVSAWRAPGRDVPKCARPLPDFRSSPPPRLGRGRARRARMRGGRLAAGRPRSAGARRDRSGEVAGRAAVAVPRAAIAAALRDRRGHPRCRQTSGGRRQRPVELARAPMSRRRRRRRARRRSCSGAPAGPSC